LNYFILEGKVTTGSAASYSPNSPPKERDTSSPLLPSL